MEISFKMLNSLYQTFSWKRNDYQRYQAMKPTLSPKIVQVVVQLLYSVAVVAVAVILRLTCKVKAKWSGFVLFSTKRELLTSAVNDSGNRFLWISPAAALAAAMCLRNHDQRDPSLQVGNLKYKWNSFLFYSTYRQKRKSQANAINTWKNGLCSSCCPPRTAVSSYSYCCNNISGRFLSSFPSVP